MGAAAVPRKVHRVGPLQLATVDGRLGTHLTIPPKILKSHRMLLHKTVFQVLVARDAFQL